MNKFLMTAAILTFFNVNLYSQQTQQLKEKTKYSYNEDKTRVTTFEYDADGNIKTEKYFDYSYETDNRVLDSITIITYLSKEKTTNPNVIDRTNTYVLATDEFELLTVDITVKNKKSILLESRSIMFTSDLSFNDFIWYRGPKISKAEAQTEAKLIADLIAEGNNL